VLALTYHRPWPALILLNHPLRKTVENRSRSTQPGVSHAIHAGQVWDPTAEQLARRLGVPDGLVSWNPDDHPTGVVGVVTVASVCTASVLGYECDDGCDGWAADGAHHWRLTHPYPVRRIQVRGMPGWWHIDSELIVPLPASAAT
jgi:hypothetical protein